MKLNKKITSVFILIFIFLLITYLINKNFNHDNDFQTQNLNDNVNSDQIYNNNDKLNSIINEEFNSYCLAVKSSNLSLCDNLENMYSNNKWSMTTECIKNIYIKKAIFENMNICEYMTFDDYFKKTYCIEYYNKIKNPELEKNESIKSLFIAFNENNLEKCDNSYDPDFCKFILDPNYNCS